MLLTTVTLTVFSVVATGKWLTGETSCGCFGSLQVHPLATLALDLSVLAVLGATAFRRQFTGESAWRCTRRFAQIASIAVLAMVAVRLVTQYRFVRATPHMQWSSGYEVVDLQPKTWIGQRLPILSQIDKGESLAAGNWSRILVRRDCSRCDALLDALEDDAELFGHGQSGQIAVVATGEALEPERSDRLRSGGIVVSRLNPEKDWHVPTPYIVGVSDGVCTSATFTSDAREAVAMLGHSNVAADAP